MKIENCCPKCGSKAYYRHVWSFGAYWECESCGHEDFSETGGPSFPTPYDFPLKRTS